MSDAAESGVPYPSEMAGPIDEWSEQIFAAFHNWPIARTGDWTRWEPGYLLLTISHVDGSEVEPIVLYSADEELTVAFGYWETHNPAPYGLPDANAAVIADHAKLLVSQWLDGTIRTAVFTDATGRWCGTTTIEPAELAPQLESAARWVRDFHPVQVEVRTPFKPEWKTFPVEPEWLKPLALSPDRLPG